MALEWKQIPGYEGYYEVSNTGEVRSYKNGRWGRREEPKKLRPSIDSKGYPSIIITVNDNKNTCRIHRLVAKAFIPNPENKKCVNHLDGNKKNNYVDNLEWCTYSENAIHAQENGLNSPPPTNYNRGEKQGSSKLTQKDVLQIRSIYNQKWFTQLELSNAYNVGQDQISRIVNYKRWTHI